MADQSRPDPARQRWAPVGQVFPIFINLVRASWPALLVIWALATGGILALSLLMEALSVPGLQFVGLTPAVLPVSFAVAMAAHRMLWPSAPDLAECLDVAMRAFPSVLLVVAARQALVSVGFAFLFVPGLAALVFLLLAPIVVMAEGPGLQAAFRRSATLVWPIGWAVLGLLFLAALSGVLLLVPLPFVAIPLAVFGDETVQKLIVAGATAAFPLSFTAMGVAIYIHVTGADETRH